MDISKKGLQDDMSAEVMNLLTLKSSGILWLQASDEANKSAFIDTIEGGSVPLEHAGFRLPEELLVVKYHIEPNIHPSWFADHVKDDLSSKIGVSAGQKPLPYARTEMTRAPDPQQEMIRTLEEWQRIANHFRGQSPILICLDGLENISRPEDGHWNIADFIPAPGDLPEGIFFVMTSKPKKELPSWLSEQLTAQLPGVDERSYKTNGSEQLAPRDNPTAAPSITPKKKLSTPRPKGP